MKPTDPTIRARVLTLRSSHSLREVAELTGLSVGTVKSLCSRAKPAEEHAALFRMPEPTFSASAAVAVAPELPPQEVVTGHRDLDAVLWLRKVIGTGHPERIAQAMQAAERITTPADELERIYLDHLRQTSDSLFAGLGAMGIGDVQGWARSVQRREQGRADALSRFGSIEAVFSDHPAESECIRLLNGVGCDQFGILNEAQTAERFDARPDICPVTLTECLRELEFWHELWSARRHWPITHEVPEAFARQTYVHGLLAKIRPRNRDEAMNVLEYMRGPGTDSFQTEKETAVLRNLIT